MDFESLPAYAILQIFDFLPFEDRVRVGGVNKRFRQLSNKAIRRIKWVKLDANMIPDSSSAPIFRSLIESCSANLQRLNVGCLCTVPMLQIIVESPYPKLTHLGIDGLEFGEKEAETVRTCFLRLLRDNRHLNTIILHPFCRFQFPADVVYENLETLQILESFDEYVHECGGLLQALSGSVPNLKHFKVDVIDENERITFALSFPTIDDFIGSTPNLQTLHLAGYDYYYQPTWWAEKSENFWRLSSLTSFEFNLGRDEDDYEDEIVFGAYNDRFLQKIIAAFPNLERFVSNVIDRLTEDITPLANLKHLRVLRIAAYCPMEDELMRLLNSCSNLRFVDVFHIFDVLDSSCLIEILESISKIRSGKFTIRFGRPESKKVWRTKSVKAALAKIKEQTGLAIRIGQCPLLEWARDQSEADWFEAFDLF